MSKKQPTPLIILILIVSSVFGGPFVFKTYHLYQDYYKDDFEVKDFFQLKVGEKAKAEMVLIPNQLGENVNFKSEGYKYNTRFHTYNVLELNIPDGVKVQDSQGKQYLLYGIERYSFNYNAQYINRRDNKNCTTKSFLFRPTHKYLDTDSVVRVLTKEGVNGETVLADTLWQYGALSDKRKGVTSWGNYLINEPETYKKHKYYGPRITSCVLSESAFLLGKYKVKSTNPLQLECSEVISLMSIEGRKSRTLSRYFSGTDLIEWSVFGVLLCVSLFFIIKLITKLMKGEPIQ